MFDLEADYYNGIALARGQPGEAWNGATKDWAIVDVPPGTKRVFMEGVGGGSQEITWQRYNGVRRSEFFSGDDERATDIGPQVKQKKKDMWTEITKDLVIREAIDSCGYQVEETDDFYYVLEYLKYVSISKTEVTWGRVADTCVGGRLAPCRDFRRYPTQAQEPHSRD